jgi:hypothetical protein
MQPAARFCFVGRLGRSNVQEAGCLGEAFGRRENKFATEHEILPRLKK